MKNIRCIITDDEPLARKGLANYVEKIENLELVALCEDVLQLQSYLQKETIDLIFLDIQMPHLTGIEWLKTGVDYPPIIFTTAYSEYALEGYNFNVIDYLLKPIAFERFFKAIQKAQAYIFSKDKTQPHEDYFFIKTDAKLEKIAFEELLFVEALQNYVVFRTTRGNFISHLTMKKVMEFLPENKFAQSHKSFIVNIDKIESIEGNQIAIQSHKISISKHLKETFLEKVLHSRFLKR
jgi:DNA-binding LytR/AlgR family response regulator